MPPCIKNKRRRKRKQRGDLLLFTTCLSALLTLVKSSCLFTPYLSVLVLSCLISSVAQSCPTLSDPMDCSMPGLPIITNSRSLLKLISIELVMPSSHLILYRPILLLPSIFLNIRVFSNKSVLRIRQSKYWSFSFSIIPSNEYLGLISFRMDWLDLLAVQGTLKSLLKHHSSKASVSAQLSLQSYSHIHTRYWKNHSFDQMDLCWQSNVSAFFNMLSRLVITFFPRSKHLLISWLWL